MHWTLKSVKWTMASVLLGGLLAASPAVTSPLSGNPSIANFQSWYKDLLVLIARMEMCQIPESARTVLSKSALAIMLNTAKSEERLVLLVRHATDSMSDKVFEREIINTNCDTVPSDIEKTLANFGVQETRMQFYAEQTNAINQQKIEQQRLDYERKERELGCLKVAA